MKWLPFLPILLLLAFRSADAQRIKLFRSIIYTAQGDRIDGILYDMTDSTVLYLPDQPGIIEQLRAGDTPPAFDVHWREIDRIVIRRKGHVGHGLLIGAGVGVVYSLGIAVFTRPDNGKGIGALSDVVRMFSIVATPIAGAGYGALTSIIPYRVRRIHQRKDAYNAAKADLKWRSIAAQRRVNALSIADTLSR